MAFEVTSELVGKVANVWVIRDDQTDLAARHVYQMKKATWMNVDWPDLHEKDKPKGVFCGGRQVDYRGLEKKSYKERMAAQKFSLNIFCTNKSKKSDNTIKIDAYENKDFLQIEEGWVCNVEIFRKVRRFNPYNNNPYTSVEIVPIRDYMRKGKALEYNIGRYNLCFKDGVLNITIKLKLVDENKRRVHLPNVFNDIKTGVELFWNDKEKGYNRWVFHRYDCERNEQCNCPIGWNDKKEYFAAGCCKVPIRVCVEEGDDNEVEISLLGPHGSHTGKLYHPPLHPHSYAHEIGHMMGFPDQYVEGHTESGAWAENFEGDFPIDDDSIMGMNKRAAKIAHFRKWKKWLKSIDSFKILKC